LHQRETQGLLWQLFFGRTLWAGIGRAAVDGAETSVDTGRHLGSDPSNAIRLYEVLEFARGSYVFCSFDISKLD
jgi:hypothetical protein